MRATAPHDGPGRDTKAEIHQAAIDLFSSRGYEKTSLREIAEQVGITKASLYYHYSSKQDILRAIIGTFFDELQEVTSVVQHVPWSPEREREVIAAYLDVMIRHRHTSVTVLRDLSAVLAAYEENVEELIKSMHEVQAWLAGPNRTPADQLRAAAVTETMGAVLSSGLTPDQISDEEAREVLLDAALAVLARRDAVQGPVPVES